MGLTPPSIALPIQSYTLHRQIVKNKNGEKGGDGATAVNEADREATVAGDKLPAEGKLTSPDATLIDRKEHASDLEQGHNGS